MLDEPVRVWHLIVLAFIIAVPIVLLLEDTRSRVATIVRWISRQPKRADEWEDD